MPRKFKGENTKAVASRERKEQAKKESEMEERKRQEDELWKDDDRLAMKKQKRKDEKEAKLQDKVKRKLELKELEMQENSTAGIEVPKMKVEVPKEEPKVCPKRNSKIEENNILFDEEFKIKNNRDLNWDDDEIVYSAKNTKNNKKEVFVDRHPERRMKTAFREYEEERLPKLREEFPNMRYSQHLKIMRQEFEKSEANPMNKPHMAYNTPDENKVLEKQMKKLTLETIPDCE